MTTFLYFDKSTPKESGANNIVINCGLSFLSDNLEIAMIKEYSKYVKLTTIDPTVSKNLAENLNIADIPFLIPNEKAISMFLTNGIGDGTYIEDESIVYTDTATINLLSFIVEIVQKNIAYILPKICTQFCEETLAHNEVADKRRPNTRLPLKKQLPMI